MPEVLVLGQITGDDVVPARPGPWRRQVGGNALYSAAGARLWCPPEQIGVVARIGCGFPCDVASLLEAAGLPAQGIKAVQTEHLYEWILYEEDGQRQSMPRNWSLRQPGADQAELNRRYLQHLGAISPAADDVPAEWLPATAIHLAAQVPERHRESCRKLRPACRFLSVDPSPHYSHGLSPEQLYDLVGNADALLPSQAEVSHLREGDWVGVAVRLHRAGFPEVVLKMGGDGLIVVARGSSQALCLPAAPAIPVDLTGAGDSFCGAYAACRGQGLSPEESAMRAAVAASLVVECLGAEEALHISRQVAEERLERYRGAVSR